MKFGVVVVVWGSFTLGSERERWTGNYSADDEKFIWQSTRNLAGDQTTWFLVIDEEYKRCVLVAPFLGLSTLRNATFILIYECIACGVRFLLPLLSRRDNISKYDNRTVKSYHTRHVLACHVPNEQSTRVEGRRKKWS